MKHLVIGLAVALTFTIPATARGGFGGFHGFSEAHPVEVTPHESFAESHPSAPVKDREGYEVTAHTPTYTEADGTEVYTYRPMFVRVPIWPLSHIYRDCDPHTDKRQCR